MIQLENNILKKIKFHFLYFLINSSFFCGTRFFKLKVRMLNSMGFSIHKSAKIVGPIYLNSTNNITIEEGCWIGKNFEILGNGSIFIEKNCDIGPYVTIFTGSHKISNYIRRAGTGLTYSYRIGKGSWIGGKTIIGNGAQIESGVVIGMNSMVIKNCKKNSLYVGSPVYKLKDINEYDKL